jgi:hypothetical protein
MLLILRSTSAWRVWIAFNAVVSFQRGVISQLPVKYAWRASMRSGSRPWMLLKLERPCVGRVAERAVLVLAPQPLPVRAGRVAGEIQVVEMLVVAAVARVFGREELLADGQVAVDAQVRRVDRVRELCRAHRPRAQVLGEPEDVGIVGDVFRRPDLDAIVEHRVRGRGAGQRGGEQRKTKELPTRDASCRS